MPSRYPCARCTPNDTTVSRTDVVSTCSSSRATYATGQYPHTHGVTGLVHRHPELSLPDDRPTLAGMTLDLPVVARVITLAIRSSCPAAAS